MFYGPTELLRGVPPRRPRSPSPTAWKQSFPLRSELCDQGLNDQNVARELDLAEERREAAAIRLAAYQQQLARGYNQKVKERRFAIGELVLKKTLPGDRDPNEGKLAPNWQGPSE